MKIESVRWGLEEGGWMDAPSGERVDAELVLVFGDRAVLEEDAFLASLSAAYPDAIVAGCSTAGEIFDVEVDEATASAVALHFERTCVASHSLPIPGPKESAASGRALGEALLGEGLRHVFILSDGLQVNGTELVRGLMETLPEGVSVTGGLAGDGSRFERTLVLTAAGAESGIITAVGFYGAGLKIGYGSMGGWSTFGPERLITGSEDNVLLELDHTSALELYRSYLGEHAEGLPATGLLFPLSVRPSGSDEGVVRTILGIEGERMVFAGDMPVGAHARLMRAKYDDLVDGAAGAAEACGHAEGEEPELAILISCVGRRLVLGQRIEEEVEMVREVLGDKTVLTGFYSYGELAPSARGGACALHNQTMTITTLREAA